MKAPRSQVRIQLMFLLLGSLSSLCSAFSNQHRHNGGSRISRRIRSSQRLLAVSTQSNADQTDRVVATTTQSNDLKNKKQENHQLDKPNNNKINNNNNSTHNANRRQPQKRQHHPWRASYHVSKKTQQKIQEAAQDRGSYRRKPIQKASAVLQTLLNMPPERCNAANLVCALTLSAKAIGGGAAVATRGSTSSEKFRSLLFQTLDVLHELVQKKCLSERQLCNAVWAIAKHYDRDPLLLPSSPQTTTAFASSDQIVLSETWDLNIGGDDPPQRVDNTIQAIASQLTDILTQEKEQLAMDTDYSDRENYRHNKPSALRETKVGELCMASWAYGVLRPRHIPPGWLAPPQIGKLPRFNNQKDASTTSTSSTSGSSSERESDFITFEQWTMNDDKLSFMTPTSTAKTDQVDPADELFDAIGEALCRPRNGHTMTTHHPSKYEPEFELMRVSSCTWSEIANLAWAFEKRGRCLSPSSEMLLRSLSREASRRLHVGGRETRSMLSRDISQLVWALGTLQQDNFRLAHDLVALVDDFSHHMGLKRARRDPRPFRDWSCPDIVQMILALAHARIDESHLLLALFEEAHSRLADGICAEARARTGRKSFLAWEVCVMLWAQARLYLTSSEGEVFDQFPQTAAACIQSQVNGGGLTDIGIGPQEQANIAWSLTVLQKHQSKEAIQLLQYVFRDAANACEGEGLIQLEHAHQLWQALFLLEEESPLAVKKVPEWFRDYLDEKWNLEKSRKKISSARHKSISQVLNLMGVAHYNEHDEDIDVAIVLKRQALWVHETDIGEHSESSGATSNAMKVAVEFDGPNHFTRKKITRDTRPSSDPVRALGHTVLKYRLLKRKGWAVVRVPYYEFDKIPFWASMERQRYLQRLLKTHANIRFSDVDISEYRSIAPNRKSRFD